MMAGIRRLLSYQLLLINSLTVGLVFTQSLSTPLNHSQQAAETMQTTTPTVYSFEIYLNLRANQVKVPVTSWDGDIPTVSSNDDWSDNSGNGYVLLTKNSWPKREMADTRSDFYRSVETVFKRLDSIVLNNLQSEFEDFIVRDADIRIMSISLARGNIKVESWALAESSQPVKGLQTLAHAVTRSAQNFMTSEWATDVFGFDGVELDVTVADALLEASGAPDESRFPKYDRLNDQGVENASSHVIPWLSSLTFLSLTALSVQLKSKLS